MPALRRHIGGEEPDGGVLLLVWPSRLVGVIIVFLVLIWWISQDVGGLLTVPHGTVTDSISIQLAGPDVMPFWRSVLGYQDRADSPDLRLAEHQS